MVFELLKLNIHVTDEKFNTIYPTGIRRLSEKHWTPVSVAKAASEFLVTSPGTRVLDIGSGAGKFCMVGAVHTNGFFTGIEQRAELVELTQNLSNKYSLDNVEFIHANITSINFNQYQAFYFYNSFYENIDFDNKIDDSVLLNTGYYKAYTKYTLDQLAILPGGTRLATYWAADKFIPHGFDLVESLYDGHLNLYMKQSYE
jgi:SAM-dependent methyltransferase